MRPAERIFQVIQILRRSTLPVTGAALAAELEVSTRTVYRDVADLMAQRVPVTGEAGPGYLLAGDYDMPPLMLTPAELEAIVLGAVGRRTRRDGGNRHFRTDRMQAAELLDKPIGDPRATLIRRREAWRSAELAKREGRR